MRLNPAPLGWKERAARRSQLAARSAMIDSLGSPPTRLQRPLGPPGQSDVQPSATGRCAQDGSISWRPVARLRSISRSCRHRQVCCKVHSSRRLDRSGAIQLAVGRYARPTGSPICAPPVTGSSRLAQVILSTCWIAQQYARALHASRSQRLAAKPFRLAAGIRSCWRACSGNCHLADYGDCHWPT